MACQKNPLLCLCIVTFLFSAIVSAESPAQAGIVSEDSQRLTLGTFASGRLDDWEVIEFEGQTDYRWLKQNGQHVLQAHSQGSASGYLFEQEIDLNQYPWLNWSWRVEKPLPAQEETTKSGDDYAARIYLIVSGRWFFWQTKALNYVWSSREVKGQHWPNAYAPDNARMLAIRDKTDQLQTWYQEKRHVRADLQAWLGHDATRIDGIAIMTDSDDSGGEALVYYGDIYFSAE